MNVSDFITFWSIIFEYDLATSASDKLVLKLRIETEILRILSRRLSLHAIIYHHGNNPRRGHYTSALKYNETSFSHFRWCYIHLYDKRLYCAIFIDLQEKK